MSPGRKTNRRQFLQGQAAVDALQDLQCSAEAEDGREALPGPNAWGRDARAEYLVQVGRRAMACDFQVFLNPGQYPGAVEAAVESLDLIEALEEQLTVYREQSEIMRINRSAAQQAVEVEPRLFELLHQCVMWSEATGGGFDITAGPLVKLWGFYTRQGRFPEPDEIEAVIRSIGSRFLRFDREQMTIRFARPGMDLNLGSVGKGYALDRCAEVLEAAGVWDYMIHGGQSSILARGGRSQQDGSAPWVVALRHPLRPERRLAELQLRDQGLGTSGSGQQFFYHRGRRYGHVLDPRTGRPAEGVLSATVLAPSAAMADAMATSFFVLGVDVARAFCERHPELAVVFVLPAARKGTVAIETIGLDDGGRDGELRVLDE